MRTTCLARVAGAGATPQQELPRKPSSYLRRIWFDSVNVYEAPAAVDTLRGSAVGAEAGRGAHDQGHGLPASDMGIQRTPSLALVEASGLDEKRRARHRRPARRSTATRPRRGGRISPATPRRVTGDHAHGARSSCSTRRPLTRTAADGPVLPRPVDTDAAPAPAAPADPSRSSRPDVPPAPGGTKIRINDFPPGAVSPMHRTETVDYGIVLSGEIVLVLDHSETTLHPGDVVIQRGTDHRWENRCDWSPAWPSSSSTAPSRTTSAPASATPSSWRNRRVREPVTRACCSVTRGLARSAGCGTLWVPSTLEVDTLVACGRPRRAGVCWSRAELSRLRAERRGDQGAREDRAVCTASSAASTRSGTLGVTHEGSLAGRLLKACGRGGAPQPLGLGDAVRALAGGGSSPGGDDPPAAAKCRVEGITVHRSRDLDRLHHNGIPTTSYAPAW